MPTEPLVSVIVPVYNVVEYLPLCLRSISEQTYRNLEIILVDDGSTDGSGAICDEFALNDSRAKVIHQPNSGLWAARNAGHEAANGEYLFFPDADDYFSPDLISLLFKAINSGNGCNLAICRMKMTSTSASVEDIGIFLGGRGKTSTLFLCGTSCSAPVLSRASVRIIMTGHKIRTI